MKTIYYQSLKDNLSEKTTIHRFKVCKRSRLNIVFLLLFLLTLFFEGFAQDASRVYGGNYSHERISNLRKNTKEYEWAKKDQQRVINRAKAWVSKTDEELWKMVPGQDLPRTIDVTYSYFNTPRTVGCLVCGKNILQFGNYPYTVDFENAPWKIKCPYCHSEFPTNDFGKFYESGLDAHGLFNPENGDTSLLYNTAHPDPEDSLHNWGVDDGYGYKKGDRAYKFIGYYTWKLWDHIIEGVASLANAFVYTGDQVYAHKAAVLLDRIADVYPSMDWKKYADMGWYHSDGSSKMGKIEGRIWETSNATTLADAYDKILSGTVGDDSLYEFFHLQSKKYELPNAKGSRELFVENVDRHLLKEIVKGILSKRIYGNEGMHQRSMATAALAFNDEKETTKWLDWVFSPKGGNIPGLIIDVLDRDGTSNEGAPGYATILGYSLITIADILENYPEYTRYRIFRDFPKFKQVFKVAYRMTALGQATPNLGDAGSTGLVAANAVNPALMAKGYLYTRDSSIAVAAYRANGNSAKGLGFDIFSKDPEWANTEIEEIGKHAGPRPVGGYLMNGFGWSLLEVGNTESATALSLNYGRTIKHAHKDLLNFDLFAFGNWITPDHGYPEFASSVPSRNEWTNNTISHNLVVVDQKTQNSIWGGKTQLFSQIKDFGIVKIDGRKAYPKLKEYGRTMALIADDEGDYLIDVFDVDGGNDHLYSFHTPPGQMTVNGVDLVYQNKGSYAGINIPEGTPANGEFPLGFSFLYDVARDNNPNDQFFIDWKINDFRGIKKEDDVHLRFHSTTPVQEVATALGIPPQNKPGNPKTLNYLLLHRKGQELKSTFVSVIEPYKKDPFIRKVSHINMDDAKQVVVKVEKINGTTDFILLNRSTEESVLLANQIHMQGEVGFIRLDSEGKPIKAILINGKSLDYGEVNLKSHGAYTGKVIKMSKEPSDDGWILVDSDLPFDNQLIGRQIKIVNKGERDANYKIKKISKEQNLTKIVVEGGAFINSYRYEEKKETSEQDSYPNTYIYDFEEGDVFEIPSVSIWARQ